MENIQISAKNLGAMALPGFCPRCFWIKLHAKKLPWQMFPGIFSTIDSYTKKIVHDWIDRGVCPESFKKYGILGYQKSPHWSKFKYQTKHGIILSGAADDIWTVKDGIMVPDYKTAKFTANADKLLPMYKVQLNGYAMIANATGMGPVVGIPLIYMEPNTSEAAVVNGARPAGFFNMAFDPHILDMEFDFDEVDRLLAKARKIYDGYLPEYRKDCKDCQALSDINAAIAVDLPF